jgi:hypothetical protein
VKAVRFGELGAAPAASKTRSTNRRVASGLAASCTAMCVASLPAYVIALSTVSHRSLRPPGTRSTPLNASLSPWFMNWRGRNRSRANIDASRGKSAYAVLAARTRIAIVPACTR